MIKLAIAGAAGRMGCEIIQTVAHTDGVVVTTAIEHAESSALGKDAGQLAGIGASGITIRAEVRSGATAVELDDFDLLIEFTTPSATLAHVEVCRQLRRGMVIGTTGLDAHGERLIRQAAQDIPIVLAANTSVGVNLCAALAEAASKVVGAHSDIEVIEAHHRNKVDAPSGTALLLAHAAATPLGKDLTKDGVFVRHGHTGARQKGTIGFSVIRGGDIAGEHTVLFIGDGERVEITHKASGRRIFAEGAIKAAMWLANQPPGLFTMRDVLGV